MESLPLPLTTSLQTFQSLMRAEVFSSFSYLLTGVLIGEAKAGTARASVFAPRRLLAPTSVGSVLASQAVGPGVDGPPGGRRLDLSLPSRSARAVVMDCRCDLH